MSHNNYVENVKNVTNVNCKKLLDYNFKQYKKVITSNNIEEIQKLKSIIEEVIAASGAASIKDMGRVMKDVLARTAGQADNQTIGALVKERLSKT